MSTKNTNADESESETEVQEQHEKDVTVTAYTEGEFEGAYEYINHVFGDLVDIDVLEMEKETKRSVEIVGSFEAQDDNGFDREIEIEHSPFSEAEKQALANGASDLELPDWMELKDETRTVKTNKHSTTKPVKEFVGTLFDEDTLTEFEFESPRWNHYAFTRTRSFDDTSPDADPGDTITQDVRVRVNATVDERRPLVHQSERSRENRYEGDEDNEHYSFQLDVHLEASSSDELDDISEEIVPTLYQSLFDIDAIDKVRLESCEQQVTKIGACYNF